MPLRDGCYVLCARHEAMTLKRIFAACEHNPDKDVDWWVKYWDKECSIQEKYMKECCKHAMV